eukprot:CAMPEP_0117698484 /NCGR_PEP_ID=MMETSP0804-20121206/29783_1 /TAXON_ID=1074897 /ORGANISM="Tetraselmis astigmatica, Strain CCMP880" /LENGTH=277 /DNA_ID=CAMNT_0005512797 /DNA_START=200 /DNA_END=1032 /DNA_ORIENTATION=-
MPLSAVPIGGKDALNKRVPKSTKYGHVKGVVNSGFNMKKLEERFDGRLANIRFRRDEKFRRVKAYELEEVVRLASLDMLLLDIRDEDEFEELHIQGAKNYQSGYSQGPILSYSNCEPEKIIVIYDMDERKAINAGNLFFEKGIDNVFVLSGGMKKLQKEAPWLLEGRSVAGGGLPSPKGSEASCQTGISSVHSFQTHAPMRRPATDGPITHNKGTANPWKEQRVPRGRREAFFTLCCPSGPAAPPPAENPSAGSHQGHRKAQGRSSKLYTTSCEWHL